MKKSFFLIACVIAVRCSSFAQCPDFLFTKMVRNADFCYDRISVIDEYLSKNDVPIDSVFAVRKGDFDILFFERYCYGESVLGGYIFAHEAIISKVKDGYIVESYFVSFDWKEPPLSLPVQISKKKMKLGEKIKVERLEFKTLNESGVNLLDKRCSLIIPHGAIN